MKELKGKKIVITGASSGIGERIAYEVARAGAVPILVARRTEKLKEIAESIEKESGNRCYAFPLDVSNEHEVERVFKEIYKQVDNIDVLINNAGFGIFKSFEETTVAEVKSMFEVNVFGLVACTKAVLPMMRQRNEGQVINIASLAGKIATPKSSAYAGTKHAVLALTNALRMELANTNIQVTAINPGPIKTSFFDIADQSGNYVKNVGRFILDPEKVARKIVATIGTSKREVQLPVWMGLGPKIYALFPNLFEKIVGKKLSQK